MLSDREYRSTVEPSCTIVLDTIGVRYQSDRGREEWILSIIIIIIVHVHVVSWRRRRAEKIVRDNSRARRFIFRSHLRAGPAIQF
jgi:hypothetical protein